MYNSMGGMTRIVTAIFVLVASLLVMFLPTATGAKKQTPTDQLTQTLQHAGLKELQQEAVRQLGEEGWT